MGALDQPRSATGDDGMVGRARSRPWLLVAIVGAAIVILAWIGWAIHVTSDNGARAGLGVVIAWPAMLAALALISLPFIGFYLLLRHLSGSEQNGDAAETSEASDADAADADEEPDDDDRADADKEPGDDDGADADEEPGDDADDGEEDEAGSEEEEEAEPETAAN